MKERSAHDLTATRDCSVPGCPNEAEQGAEMCTPHERRRQQRGTPEPRRLLRDPVVPEGERKPCRVCGETSTGRYTRGALANLCEEHEEEAREAVSRASIDRHARRNGEPAPPVIPVAPAGDAPDRFVGRLHGARTVLAAAEMAETARLAVAEAERALGEAEDAYRAALEELYADRPASPPR